MVVITVYGPMFSGKSSFLLEYERKCMIANKNYILVNHSTDTRYNNDCKIMTHNGKKSLGKNYSVTSLSDIDIEVLKNCETIIIDECQFFDDISQFLEGWGFTKTIVCGGLNSTFKMEPFKNMCDVISRSDKLIHLTSICEKCGDDAPFTKRLSEEVEVNVVGGIDKYSPRCRECFIK
jgi:thymidine kinase